MYECLDVNTNEQKFKRGIVRSVEHNLSLKINYLS